MTMSDELFKALMMDLKDHLPPGYKTGEDWTIDMDPKQVAACALVRSIFKKYSTSDGTTVEGDAVAAKKFVRSNERCRTWVYNPNTSLDEEMMGEFKSLLYRFFYPGGYNLVFHLNDLFDRGRCGPGVSVGSRGEDFYTKFFDSKLTCTSEKLVRLFYQAVANDLHNTWDRAESNRSKLYGDAELVQGSRFSFVPKDDTQSRMIAIEPSLNMFYQLGLGRLLEERLVSFFGLDITSQPQINREAARFGSVTNDLVTLDLSNASDSLGLPMLKWALPPPVLEVLMLLRSPCGSLFNELLQLHMVSTMGNGFTFPLETLVFSCVVVSAIKSFRVSNLRPYAVYLEENGRAYVKIPGRADRDFDIRYLTSEELVGYWGVFGDDIVCHRKVADRVVRLLTLLGFEVNRDKSFVEGPFRESCGCDYWNGRDVRGVYIKRLDSAEARYVAINALNVWSAKVGIYLPNTVRRLVTTVRWLPVPPAENHDAGIRVPYHLAGDFPRDEGTQAIIYRKRLSNPKKLTIKDGEIRVPRKVRRRFFNPEGLLLAFLHGSVKSGRITLRQSDIRYHTKRARTPYWDYVPPTSDIASLCGVPRWESAVEVNLS
jgi:hypothetical protein